MEKADESTIREEIILVLRRDGPLRLGEIARKAMRSESGVSYQLQKMMKKGLIVCSDEKRYRLAQTDEMEKAILKAVQGKTLNVNQIIASDEVKPFEHEKIRSIVEKMSIEGLLEKVESWEPEPHNLLKTVEKGLRLSYLGCKRLNVCYFCNKPVPSGFAIIGVVREESYATIDYGIPLHPTCISKWLQVDWGEGEYYSEGTSCSFCGLPITTESLISIIDPGKGIDPSALHRYLSEKERGVIRDDKGKTVFPIWWIEDRSDVKTLVSQIMEKAKEKSIDLGQYDEANRTDELWFTAERLIKRKNERFNAYLRLSSPLTDPLSIAYSQIGSYWAHNVRRHEFIKSAGMNEKGELEEEKGLVEVKLKSGAHAPVWLDEKGRPYHLYCYKLAKELGAYPVKTDEEE